MAESYSQAGHKTCVGFLYFTYAHYLTLSTGKSCSKLREVCHSEATICCLKLSLSQLRSQALKMDPPHLAEVGQISNLNMAALTASLLIGNISVPNSRDRHDTSCAEETEVILELHHFLIESRPSPDFMDGKSRSHLRLSWLCKEGQQATTRSLRARIDMPKYEVLHYEVKLWLKLCSIGMYYR